MRKPKLMTSGFKSPNYTETPNDFFDMIADKHMTEAEIRVTLVMIRHTFGFHRQGYKMSMRALADAAGLSYNSAKAGALAAEERGTFRRTNSGTFRKQSEWELVVDEDTDSLDEKVSKFDVSTFDTVSTVDTFSDNLPQPLTLSASTIEAQVGLNKEINILNKGNDSDAGHLITAPEAISIFRQVTGMATIPPISLSQVLDAICSMVAAHGCNETIERMNKAYNGWKNCRTKDGRPYRKTNMAWIDYAVAGEVPGGIVIPDDGNQRINSDGSFNL